MSKVKRNDPCPCGSGKKYKRCCGTTNAPNTNNQRINNELYQLHTKFISAVMDKYDNKLSEVKARYTNSSIEKDQETAEIYQTGIVLWILFHVPFLSNNKTVFDDFFAKNSKNLSKPAIEIFSQWKKYIPSVYKVVSLSKEKRTVFIDDIRTHEQFEVPYQAENDFIKGSLIIGTLVPYADQYGFFFTMIKLFRHDEKLLSELLEKYAENGDGLHKNFPEFLSEALLSGKEDEAWNNRLHEQVAQLFANHMIDKDVSDDVLFKGVSMWQDYCAKSNPSYKNVPAYAAALEYLVQKNVLHNEEVTQSQLAQEYVCSAGSISTNYRKLAKELKN
ncbi:YecA family protein [Virgibacillus halodenitrificans]|uniref:YecA family protein n=1 Tax=Virgibacillus halodenitrificans TaxID=1482 RepID=UPI000EF45BF4|nr:SEC-C domain-containing protein [Virgibacillus halodenitrificans]